MSISMGNLSTSTTKPETFMLTVEQLDKLPEEAKQALEQVDDLKYFLATAPANWQVDQIIRRYLLPTGEYVSCVLWKNLFHITGTDIVRALAYRFEAFGRPVRNVKKFEEGIFSDLRNLKPGSDASLEDPKSAFLDLLYKNNCIRTQKKQKVFYWFSVPHDRLFLDALERDLKRERMGTETTTVAIQEPALSFVFDASQSLYEQLTKSLQQSAASEVGASLAAQQAHHNMLAHLQGSSTRFSVDATHGGPSYRGRSHSIVSAVPIDYRDQASIDRKPVFQLPAVPVQNGRQSRITSLTQDYMHDSLDQLSGVHGQSYERQISNEDFANQDFGAVGSGLTQPYADGAEMYDDEDEASYTMVPNGQQAHLDYNDTYATMPAQRYRSSMADHEFAVPYDTSSNFQNYQAELQGYHLPPPIPDVVPGRSLSRNFSMIEGSSTYKQRRRRQSIPSSLLLAGQAQEARARQQQKAAEQIQAAAQYQQYANDTRTHHLQQHKVIVPGRVGLEDAYALETEGYSASRTSSVADYGVPYSTKSLGCPVGGCDRAFRRLEHLKRHVKTHDQGPPFVCNTCGKKFAKIENFVQHQATHEIVMPLAQSLINLPSAQNDYSFEQINLDEMSDYSEMAGTDAFSVADLGSRYGTEEPLSFHDPAELTLYRSSDDEAGETGDADINVDDFRNSLQEPSPKTVDEQLRDASVVQGTSRDTQSRMSDSSDVGSISYVPEYKEDLDSRSAAPRSLYSENWLDDEVTPRQAQFGAGHLRVAGDLKSGASATQMW